MNNQVSYSINIALLKKLLLDEYFARSRQTVSDITRDNLSLSKKYQYILNRIIEEQVVNLVDTTMKQVVHADSSIAQHNDDVVKLNIAAESSSREGISKIANNKLFEKKLLAIMHNENYTSGEICASESFVEETIQQVGSDCTMIWLMQVYEANYHRPNILIGILHMLSHFSYDGVKPYGPIMALALLQHKSTAVREFSIKAFENWNSKDSLVFLKNVKCDQVWLQEYLEEVISDIENE